MAGWTEIADLTGPQGPAGFNATGAAEDGAAVAAFMGARIPVDTTDFASLQAAADAAVADGKVFFASGTVTTDQTLIINSDANLGGLVYNYTGTSVAVQVGTDTSGVVLRQKNIVLPQVNNTSKVSTGWAGATTGVKVINTMGCIIGVPYITGFVTGLLCYGKGQGLVHTTFNLQGIHNNKVNVLLDADTTGWVNQNVFINGQLSHESTEGLNVAGTRHVKAALTTFAINNNTFLNTSFEYGTAEYHLDIEGSNNQFLNCRYESVGGARVLWGATAIGNQIFYGNASGNIVFTQVTGALRNHVYTEKGASLPRSAAMVMENTGSSALPVQVIMEAGGIGAGADPATAYAVSVSADATAMKRGSEAYDRIRLDNQNSKIYIGDGSANPARYIAAAGANLELGVQTQTTAPTAGGAGALPATPAGYMTLYIAGAARKVAYY